MFYYFNEKGLKMKEIVEKEYDRFQHIALQLNDEEFFIFYLRDGENNFKLMKIKENKFIVSKKVISLPQKYNSKIIDFFKELYNNLILKQNQRFGNFKEYKATLEERKTSFMSKIGETHIVLFNNENSKNYIPIIENFIHDEYVIRFSYKQFKGSDKYIYWESIWIDKYMNNYSYKYYHGDCIEFQTSQQAEDFVDLLKLLITKLDVKQVTNPIQYLC